MNKRILVCIIGACVVAVLGISGVAFSKNKVDTRAWGQANKEAINDTTVALTINGQDYLLSGYNSYRMGLQQAQGDFTEQEILEKYIRKEVIQQEVERRGLTVSEEELNSYTEKQWQAYENVPEIKKLIDEYIEGAGITLAQHKESSKELYRRALLAEKLKDEILSERTQKFSGDSQSDGEYFDLFVENLVYGADVEIVDSNLKEIAN